jgi:hypothetical protein
MPSQNSKQRFFVIVPIQDENKDHYFGLTAIDNEGNEQDNIKQNQKIMVIQGKSVDDLPLHSEWIVPLPESTLNNYNIQTQTLTFSTFKNPTINVDGTPATDFKDAILLYKKREGSPPENPTLSYFTQEIVLSPTQGSPLEIPLPTQAGATYDLLLVARDNSNNPLKDAIAPSELGATVLELTIPAP